MPHPRREAQGRGGPVGQVGAPQLRGGHGEGHAGGLRADKARAFAVARAEAVEAAAVVEIAALCGDTPTEAAREVARVADRLVALLTGLAR